VSISNNLAFALGETWEIDVACTDGDGEAVSLIGGVVSFRLAGAALEVDTDSETGTIEITDAAAGTATVRVTPDQQAGLAPELYSYAIRATLADGRIFEQRRGTINVRDGAFADFAWTPPRPRPPSLDHSNPNSFTFNTWTGVN
jgi:hypothetical protein